MGLFPNSKVLDLKTVLQVNPLHRGRSTGRVDRNQVRSTATVDRRAQNRARLAGRPGGSTGTESSALCSSGSTGQVDPPDVHGSVHVGRPLRSTALGSGRPARSTDLCAMG